MAYQVVTTNEGTKPDPAGELDIRGSDAARYAALSICGRRA